MHTITANVTAMSVAPGASTASTKITAELLQCRLCSLKYRVDGRRPIALRCVHTFCEACLEQLLRDQTYESQKQRRNKRQQLICPTCETITPLGRGCTPSSLPVNPSIMELLGIFDRSKVRPNEVSPGFSQVKVGTAASRSRDSAAANGQLGHETNGTMSALMRNKIDPHYGLDLTNHCLYGDSNVEEIGSGTANHVNWVSTVNIGGSAPQQQHTRQQQQKHGSASLLASQASLAPAAMTSAVTSVSTLKMPPHQSSSTLSSDVVLSRDTNAGPTSVVPGVANMCCRCGLRPAAVSVASSSQTMALLKLCSTCRNQTATRRSNDEQRPPAAASAAAPQQTARMTTKPQDNFVAASNVPAANLDPAPETLPRRQTNETANTRPYPAQDDNTSVKNVDSSGPLNRVKPTAAGFVANRTSTIEVRRRSAYIENRSRAAPTQDNDRCVNGTPGDQLVHPTTVQTLSTSTGSKPRQVPAASVQQRPAVEDTPPDVPPDAVLTPISQEMPTNPGSNAATGSNTRELSERSSAPSITEIYPLPCNNPPYNPDFEESRSATWSSTQPNQRTSDTPAAGRPDLNPTVLGSQAQHERKQQSADISAMARSGLALSFTLSNSRHQYPAEQPPKYEDIINENDTVTATAPEAASSQTQAVLHTLTDPVATAANTSLAMKLARSFGKYGEISTQPGVFRTPGRISVSSAAAATEDNSTRVVVGDSANGTVQVFSDAGECLSMLRADGVRGCCLTDNNSRLLIATDRGVEAYDINGSKKDTIPLGAVLNVVPYGRGFIAVQPKSLSLFKGTSFSTLTRTLTTKAKPGQYNRLMQFDDACDVAVNSQQDLVVLEAASGGLITVMTDDGYIKSTITATQLDACGRLEAPSAVAVDSAHNIVVSESGRHARVLLFGANGRLQRVLHGPSTRAGTDSQSSGPWPTALSVGPDDRLYIVMRADKFAEIRVYEYL